ncbi:RhuM family protein [Bacteroidota bacterium]
MAAKGEIKIYQTDDNQIQIDVRLEKETVWLNQYQMAELFQTDRTSVLRHLKNIYRTGELNESSTCAKIAQVQIEGKRSIKRDILFYNLDIIISVGYRVNSIRGTQFRIWANKVLKEYLLTGYSLNERLLQRQSEKLMQLNNAIKLISSVSASDYLSPESKDSFLTILEKYSTALNILDDYDYKRFKEIAATKGAIYTLKYAEVRKVIDKMRPAIANSKYFGKEKDESLKSSISAIYQTFDAKDLYPSIEEKAANLLYFLVKNHSFVDGNKRIAASIFLYFLDKNKALNINALDNNFLVALTLMIANSKPSDKDLIVNIVSALLQRNI